MTNIFVFLIYLTYTDSKLIAFYYLSLRFEDKLETLKKKKKKEKSTQSKQEKQWRFPKSIRLVKHKKKILYTVIRLYRWSHEALSRYSASGEVPR